eukprot:TRINITY_DN17397_c0_g2_i3.p1 TRINITY_DN17397_c0_g2~~TRINITY_DN17397_c0_g2_i3.p1  ORF type:complete len:358 (+),score=66.58 TRINITY_DN17397_c0_g2_i3:101-1174(+)
MTPDEEEEWRQSIEDEDDEETLEKLLSWNLPQTDGFFEAPSGNRLHVRATLPVGQAARAVLLYCHGLNGHVNGRWYAGHFIPLIASKGFAVFAVDIMGHGYSEGERSFVEDWDAVFDDLSAFLEALFGVAEPSPDEEDFNAGVSAQVLGHIRSLPIFVTGQSMGGMIGMYAGLRLQSNDKLQARFRGAVLGCPSLAVDLPAAPVRFLLRNIVVPLFKSHEMPPWVSSSSKSMSSWSYDLANPTMRQQAEMDIRDCAARFPGQALGWQKGMRWGTAAAFSDVFARVEEDMEEIEYPFLLIHDPDDKVCFISGSEKLVERSPSNDKTLHRMNAHGLHCLPMYATEEYVSRMAEWIYRRL